MKNLRTAVLAVALVCLAAALSACGSPSEAPVRFTEYTDPESAYCIEMEPVVERLQAEYGDRIEAFDVVDVTTSDGTAKAENAGIFVTPTFVIADGDGAEIDRVIGATTEEDLRSRLDDAIAAAGK